jgi:hypothetical protein
VQQRITVSGNPTRWQWRVASGAILAEVRGIEEAERRVLRKFGDQGMARRPMHGPR